MLKLLYQRLLSSRIINKMLLLYIVISIVLFSSFSIFISNVIGNILLESILDHNTMILNNLKDYMTTKNDLVRNLVYTAYLEKEYKESNNQVTLYKFLNSTLDSSDPDFIDMKAVIDVYFDKTFMADPSVYRISIYKENSGIVYHNDR